MLAALVCAVAIPAAASAATLWVSPNAPSAPFNSCEHPSYSSIQAAVNGPGTVIHVCGGTYNEQIQIERSVTINGYEGAIVGLPASPAKDTTPCDLANETGSGLISQDAVSICGNVKVVIKSLNINAVWPGQPIGSSDECGYRLYGIVAAGGAKLELNTSTVTGARPKVINGCQYGVGVQIGTVYSAPAIGKLTSAEELLV